ncbi:MAG TPA: hypothetical protein PKD53_10825 [Chloroflexaceae bacterium]|nr:hypothetical protein [Chloroflexaceae bacterium]
MEERSRGIPMWLWGALFAALLIVLSTRGRLAPGNEALREVFAAQPTPAGLAPGFTLPQLDLGALPAELQASARDLLATLGAGGAGRPVQPAVETPRLRVEVAELRPAEDGLRVLGEVTNISSGALEVPISAFELRDSAGASYVAGGGASATLRPGESTPLELTVPLPAGRGLLLVTNLPPDQPVEQKLIVVETPTP